MGFRWNLSMCLQPGRKCGPRSRSWMSRSKIKVVGQGQRSQGSSRVVMKWHDVPKICCIKCSLVVDVWQMYVKIRFNLLDVWQPVCRGTLQSRNQNFIFLQKRRLDLNWNTFWSNLSTDKTWMDYLRCQTGKTNVVLEYLGKILTRICRNVAKTVPDRKPPVLLGTIILWLYNMANPNIKVICSVVQQQYTAGGSIRPHAAVYCRMDPKIH